MNRKFLYLFMYFFPLLLAAQDIKQMEFVNQPIKDILFTLADATGTSIITDHTVSGKGSYHFTNTNLEDALTHFLSLYNLYFVKKDNIFYISRIFTSYDIETGDLSVQAKGVPLQMLFEKISVAIGKTILFDPLPAEPVMINAHKLPVTVVLEIIMHRFKDFKVENFSDYFYIKKDPMPIKPVSVSKPFSITKNNSLFSINAESLPFSEALTKLFTLAGKEYSLLNYNNTVLKNIFFKNKPFNILLRLILEQANADFTERDGLYYIYDVHRNEVLKTLETSDYITLHHLPVHLLPSLLPPGISGSTGLKIDKENNSVILSGTGRKTKTVKDFISKLETEYSRNVIKRVTLSYITVEELCKALPPEFVDLKLTPTTDPYSFLIEASAERTEEFLSFTGIMDRERKTSPISLKYIRSSDLVKNLPPMVNRNEILQSHDPNMIFYTGTGEKLVSFRNSLDYIDKPIPQIRYELLVVQYQRSGNEDFSLNFSNKTVKNGTQSTFLGSLGNLLNLNLDIVSTFGYQFALGLNAKIGNSKARVMADTTLNGLTGEDISFQNTNTYRYRDMEIDPDTGKTLSTGVTREITSGLVIRINGWVSGDETITMNVKATVSKRGADVSSLSGNPPPTSEKVVNTHVRTRSGKPVVIGGLFQQEKDTAHQKTPLLGDIPILGKIFSTKAETTRNTEMVIYIIPSIEKPMQNKTSIKDFFRKEYQNFFAGADPWN